MEIKQATIQDAPAVHEIVQAAFEQYRGALPVSVGALDETVDDVLHDVSAGRVLLAFDGAIPVGTVRYELKPDYFYVGRLAVLPSVRGRGIGAALMAHVEMLALSLGQTSIQLGTRQSIPDNLRFYESLGYIAVERAPHPRGPDIVVWFEKVLGDNP